MAAITSYQVISHQDYSSHPHLRRIIRINEKETSITHFIDFVLDEQNRLIANVVHRQIDLKKMPQVEITEDKIYYLADRTQLVYESGLPPAALPFPRLPDRDKMVSTLIERSVEVVDILIDHSFYERLALHKTPDPITNRTYILMAPAPQGPPPSLHFSPSPSSTQQATPPELKTPDSPAFKLYLEPSLEAAVEVAPAPAGSVDKPPTAYQELSDI